MSKNVTMTPEYTARVQKNLELWGEHMSYVMEHPSELDRLDGSIVVFDERDVADARAHNDGRKVVLVEKTYKYTYV